MCERDLNALSARKKAVISLTFSARRPTLDVRFEGRQILTYKVGPRSERVNYL